MQKWDYAVLAAVSKEVATKLLTLGDQGWELVTILEEREKGWRGYKLFFKRPKEEAEETSGSPTRPSISPRYPTARHT